MRVFVCALNQAVLKNDVLKTDVPNEAAMLPMMYRACPYKTNYVLNEAVLNSDTDVLMELRCFH